MFGYACRETPESMPLPIMLAHKLAKQLSEVRRAGTVPYLRPDGKTQVTIEYAGDRPVRLDTVVVSTQHAPDINLKELLAPDIRDYVVEPVLADAGIDCDGFRLLVNPTGRFEIGGAPGDARPTGTPGITHPPSRPAPARPPGPRGRPRAALARGGPPRRGPGPRRGRGVPRGSRLGLPSPPVLRGRTGGEGAEGSGGGRAAARRPGCRGHLPAPPRPP